MSFLKKQSVGFYFIILAVILAAAGTIAYVINSGTDYFSNLGINSGIMSFERNASTMSDMMSAVAGIVLCFLAVIFNIVGSFFKVVKDEK